MMSEPSSNAVDTNATPVTASIDATPDGTPRSAIESATKPSDGRIGSSLESMKANVLTKVIARDTREPSRALKPGAVSVTGAQSDHRSISESKKNASILSTGDTPMLASVDSKGKFCFGSPGMVDTKPSHDHTEPGYGSTKADVLAKAAAKGPSGLSRASKPGAVSVDSKQSDHRSISESKKSASVPSTSESPMEASRTCLESIEADVLAKAVARGPIGSTRASKPGAASVDSKQSDHRSISESKKSASVPGTSESPMVASRTSLESMEADVLAKTMARGPSESPRIGPGVVNIHGDKSPHLEKSNELHMVPEVKHEVAMSEVHEQTIHSKEPMHAPQSKEDKKDDVVVDASDIETGSMSKKKYEAGIGEMTDDGLAIAQPVSMEKEFDDEPVLAEEFDPDYKQPFYKNRKFLGCSTFSVLIIVIIVSVSLYSAKENAEQIVEETIAPTPKPTTARYYAISKRILAVSPSASDENTDSFHAMDWIINEDERQVDPADPFLLQRYILALFYFSTSGDDWKLCSYNTTAQNCSKVSDDDIIFEGTEFLGPMHECEWFGIKCSKQSYVEQINLSENNLNGTIPSEVSRLTYLRRMTLHLNLLSGTLPLEFGQMQFLNDIDLYSNQLTGPLPEEIYDLKNLWYLDITDNLFTGTISTRLGELLNLKIFWIGWNSFSGTIPEAIGNLENLQFFESWNCDFTGTLPSSMSNLVNMKYLVLRQNLHNETIPTWIDKLQNLRFLDLSDNAFTGTIPDELYNIPTLEFLRFDRNLLSGTISERIGELERLWYLMMYLNEFEGTVPSSIGNLKRLQTFYLSNNKFIGSLPDSICNLKNFELSRLKADCRNEFGTGSFECSCCTKCCDHLQKDVCIDVEE